MNEQMSALATGPRSTKVALCGLAIGILGLAIQWMADPAKFPGFPPGIIVVLTAGAIVAFGPRWWWTPVFAVLVGLWIVVGGFLSGQLTANLASGEAGTIAGNVVMCLGLIIAAVTGVFAMIEGRRRADGGRGRRPGE